MESSKITRSGSIALAITALLSATPASAQLSDGAVSCRAAIAKNMGKALKTAHKVIAGCHKARDKDPGLAGTDCNDLDVADMAKLKFDKTRTKSITAITDACNGQENELTAANDDGGDIEWYVSCPVDPCSGTDDRMNTMLEVASCMMCVAQDSAETAGVDTLGLPTMLDRDEAKCHGAIAKGYGKFLNTAYKSETACQGDADDLGNNALEGCVDSDPKDKVDKAVIKAGEGLTKACTGLNLADLDGCANDTVENLIACSRAAWEANENDAFTHTYLTDSRLCPTTVRTTILGGCSTIGDPIEGDGCSVGAETGTVLSVGWKGIAHGVDVTDNYTLAVDVTCTGTEKGMCGTCTSTGISYDNPQAQDFTRCADDPWTKCSMPFANDPVCNGNTGGLCKYYLGPPLAVSASGTPTCTLNVINADIIGATGDPDLGTASLTVDLRAIVHNGIGQHQPCPYCRNDPAPQDGNTSGGACVGGGNAGNACTDDAECPLGNCAGNFGSCYGGPRDGQPCDVQGFDLTFANANQLDQPSSGNSLDCPPTAGANISGSGLAITLPLTTGLSAKSAEDACESPNESLDCFCGICSGNSSQSCNTDAECNMAGPCTAGGLAPGVARLPNNCSDGICTPVSSDRGVCSTAPNIESFCSGMLFANGKGVLSCGADEDCESLETGSLDPDDWVCPNDDCGACTEDAFRSCFVDPIQITGTPDPLNPILAGTFCLPPSSNGTVNSTTGSPGPGTVQTDSIVQLRY
jgi:hypothetical protein